LCCLVGDAGDRGFTALHFFLLFFAVLREAEGFTAVLQFDTLCTCFCCFFAVYWVFSG